MFHTSIRLKRCGCEMESDKDEQLSSREITMIVITTLIKVVLARLSHRKWKGRSAGARRLRPPVGFISL
jgi:hypothetical protein